MVKIKKAESIDLEEILELQKKCYLAEAEIYNDFTIPPLKQDLNSIHNDFKNSVILKAENDKEIIGSVRAYKTGDTCLIGRLIVSPDFQNKGIGKLLMQLIEQEFSDCKRFELFTGHLSAKNLYLYKKIGYSEFKKEEINEKLTLVYLEKLNSD